MMKKTNSPRPVHRKPSEIKPVTSFTAPAKDRLRIIPLGGLEEIGRNMTLFEYNNDIIIVDCGLMFPDEKMMGVDYIVPNVEYLKKRQKNIRGMLITHG